MGVNQVSANLYQMHFGKCGIVVFTLDTPLILNWKLGLIHTYNIQNVYKETNININCYQNQLFVSSSKHLSTSNKIFKHLNHPKPKPKSNSSACIRKEVLKFKLWVKCFCNGDSLVKCKVKYC